MGQATLGEIKEYLKEKGISIEFSSHDRVFADPSKDVYGNPVAEKCFQYYIEHSTEIEDWRKRRNQEMNDEQPVLGPKM